MVGNLCRQYAMSAGCNGRLSAFYNVCKLQWRDSTMSAIYNGGFMQWSVVGGRHFGRWSAFWSAFFAYWTFEINLKGCAYVDCVFCELLADRLDIKPPASYLRPFLDLTWRSRIFSKFQGASVSFGVFKSVDSWLISCTTLFSGALQHLKGDSIIQHIRLARIPQDPCTTTPLSSSI